MKALTNYRPDEIDFIVESNQVPSSLGTFENADKARLFVAENLLGIQTKVTTERYMDNVEIEALRDMYTQELENELPLLRKELIIKEQELERAKQNAKEAKETVDASYRKITQLADEVNERVTEITLDPEHTWEIPYQNKRHYFTFIDNELKLCKIEDIPSYESADLLTTSERNAKFFQKLKVANG